jgi:nucleoside-diphosphate-sugar epimerase
MAGMNGSSYGSLKRVGECYTSSLNGKTVRLWNVYGKQNCSKKAFVITDFLNMAQSMNRINMRTSGEEKRQFLYVEDCCKCFEILMNDFDKIEDKCLDVSSFKWITIKEVAEIVSSNFNNCKVFTGYEKDDIQRGSVKEPSNKVLKYWEPETSIQEGIKKLINVDIK